MFEYVQAKKKSATNKKRPSLILFLQKKIKMLTTDQIKGLFERLGALREVSLTLMPKKSKSKTKRRLPLDPIFGTIQKKLNFI